MKRFVSCALILSLIICSFCSCSKQKERFSETYIEYFDTASVIVGYEYNEEKFKENCDFIKKQLTDYNMLYDIYKSYEGVNNIFTINKMAGVSPVSVDKRIIDLLDYCIEIYELTDGMTNVAMGSVLSIWHDYRERGINDLSNASVPDINILKEAAKHTDINNIIIDRENNTVYLSDPKMTLDVGAVAKGYATEQIARQLTDMGVENYTLNIGGNIRTLGSKQNDEPWIAAVENPDTKSDQPYILKVKIAGQSFVTSGTYQRYYTVNGQRYHHIINPDTLFPQNDYLSVSVYTKDSGLADSLSTALFNMGHEKGKTLVDSLQDTEAMWVTNDGKIIYSNGFKNIVTEYLLED